MFKRILIATDGSELAEKAVVQGLGLASELRAEVLVLTVVEPWWIRNPGWWIPPQPVIKAYERFAEQSAARITTHVIEGAKEKEILCSAMHIKGSASADGIIEGAKQSGCDLIIMSSHGRRGLGRLLLGSVAAEVLVRSTIPVLVCR
jgi:nucleotide-binding universal stress UspA family protein